jgi:hypothetical protein
MCAGATRKKNLQRQVNRRFQKDGARSALPGVLNGRHTMTRQAYRRHLARRAAISDEISGSPEKFKACAQCLSVSHLSTRTCPICGTYRWYYSAEAITVIAALMRKNPFPVTAGVVPRI